MIYMNWDFDIHIYRVFGKSDNNVIRLFANIKKRWQTLLATSDLADSNYPTRNLSYK